jgi:hypothetical protein
MTREQGDFLLVAAGRALDALRPGATAVERDSAREQLDQAMRDIAMGRQVSTQARPDFEGPAYDPEFDRNRLANQLGRIYGCMRDGKWRTLAEIRLETTDSEASISAQLRHLRKPRFGRYVVERRHRGDPKDGLYEYRVLPPADRVQRTVEDIGDLKRVAEDYRSPEIL